MRDQTRNRLQLVQFAAYIAAASVPLYQLGGMLVWGGGDLLTEPLGTVLLGFALLSVVGAVYGTVAAAAYFLFRWFFKLDAPYDGP